MIYRYIFFALTLSTTLFWISFSNQSHAQLKWNTFEEKDGIFSIQIPSNWKEEEIPDVYKLSPVDYIFRYDDQGNSFAWIELMISGSTDADARSIADSYISYYQQFRDFNLLKSAECNTFTLNNIPACSILSSQQLEGEQRRNVLNVISVIPNGTQTDVVFITSSNIYEAFYPLGEYIIKSLDVNSTKVNQIVENQSIGNLHSEILDYSTQNDTGTKQQTFRSIQDNFVISEPQGFGFYDERESNIFSPGESILLYIEPTGFEYGTITDNRNTTLYTVDFTADFRISDTQGNVLAKQQGLPVSDIVSHHKNKEVFIPFTITQKSPFPPGNYVITYTINDTNSGKSFDIVKEIVISEKLFA